MLPTQLLTGRLLVGSVVLALIGFYTAFVKTDVSTAEMRLVTASTITTFPNEFTLTVEVESPIPVNAFAGIVEYDAAQVEVVSIDYNTSIADLWVEEPWYSAGAGTISFAGGTTKPGAFSGTGTLLTVTWRPLKTGQVSISLANAEIYIHDGLGTEAAVPETLDTLFTVESIETRAATVASNQDTKSVAVVPEEVNFDLNNDNKVSFADISIFMLNLFGTNLRYDFNQDGAANRTDLDLLLKARDRGLPP